jgi:hypothetical protein
MNPHTRSGPRHPTAADSVLSFNQFQVAFHATQIGDSGGAARQHLRLGSILGIAVGKPNLLAHPAPSTQSLSKDHQPQERLPPSLESSMARRVLGRTPPKQRPVRHSACQQTARCPASAMASPLSSMCSAGEANEGAGWRRLQRRGTAGTDAEQGRDQAMGPETANPVESRGSWQCGEAQKCPHHHLPHTTCTAKDGQVKPEAGVGRDWGRLVRGHHGSWGPYRAECAAGQGRTRMEKAVPSATIIHRAMACVPKCWRAHVQPV